MDVTGKARTLTENGDDHRLAGAGQMGGFKAWIPDPALNECDLVHDKPGFFQPGQGLGFLEIFHHALLDQREFPDAL